MKLHTRRNVYVSIHFTDLQKQHLHPPISYRALVFLHKKTILHRHQVAILCKVVMERGVSEKRTINDQKHANHTKPTTSRSKSVIKIWIKYFLIFLPLGSLSVKVIQFHSHKMTQICMYIFTTSHIHNQQHEFSHSGNSGSIGVYVVRKRAYKYIYI